MKIVGFAKLRSITDYWGNDLTINMRVLLKASIKIFNAPGGLGCSSF